MNRFDIIKFWYSEWKEAERESHLYWAAECKEKYSKLIIDKLRQELSMYYRKALRQYPTIYLN